MSINEWHTNTGICGCNNCYEFRCREMDKIKIKKIIPIGTVGTEIYNENISPWCTCSKCYQRKVLANTKIIMGTTIDDGEDGCFINYPFLRYDKHLEANQHINDLDEQSKKIRQFASGAIRDTSEGKLEYARFNSPLVMKRYAEYMDLHRKQSDGNLREPDNWMNLFGDNHEDVCLDSLMRHLMDVWLINKGFPNEAREDIESALCAILFNVNAYLFKILLDKQKGKETNESK